MPVYVCVFFGYTYTGVCVFFGYIKIKKYLIFHYENP